MKRELLPNFAARVHQAKTLEYNLLNHALPWDELRHGCDCSLLRSGLPPEASSSHPGLEPRARARVSRILSM